MKKCVEEEDDDDEENDHQTYKEVKQATTNKPLGNRIICNDSTVAIFVRHFGKFLNHLAFVTIFKKLKCSQ